ncbi:MAG: leucine-rich repeat protein [Erysipelotrichaceae bacterium]|nr:leucine-rich repeat protein [Erysipelotrichaceae bacterium]
MSSFKCKMCGAELDVKEGQTVATCSYCGSKQTVANPNDERKKNLFNRANSLRANCEFDKALVTYQTILSIFPNEPEAYWGLTLCKYGIEYVKDPSSKEMKPTIHRMSYESILKDKDYLKALEYADVIAKEEYEAEANEIADIQTKILQISQKEEPFDIFICYKETDANGKRTPDSVIAQDIYTKLTGNGYKVFFARITLENKLGRMYEPYIFAALNSAKVMLVIGTKKEYFEAVWVKNEWSRFIDLMQNRPDHYLIPCYKDMDAYEMPEEFLPLQSQDLGKLGFMQDLTRGIDKLLKKDNKVGIEKHVEKDVINFNNSSLIKRAKILIEDEDYEKADEVIERALDENPTSAQAYILKLLVTFEVPSLDELMKLYINNLDTNNNYIKAYKYGTEEEKRLLNEINDKCIDNVNNDLYNDACLLVEKKQYKRAIGMFNSLKNYKDSAQKITECKKLLEIEQIKHKKKGWLIGLVSFIIISLLTFLGFEMFYIPPTLYFDNLEYAITNGSAYVFRINNKKVKEISVPKYLSYKGKIIEVTGISEGAFLGCKEVEKLYLDVMDKSLLTYFSSSILVKTIKSVELGTNVYNIVDDAFKGCSSLTDLTFYYSVEKIGESAFDGCTSLTNVNYNGLIEDWCNISFAEMKSNPMYYASSIQMPIMYGNTYTYVINTPTQINVPDTVTNIGPYQFYGFKSVTSLQMDKSVTTISEHAFSNCTSLSTITLSKNLTSVGIYAFANCKSINTVYYPNKIENWNNISFANEFSNPMYYGKRLYVYDKNSNYHQASI